MKGIIRKYSIWLLLMLAVLLTVFFVIYSARLTKDLSLQEQERMQLWAEATQELIIPGASNSTFPLEVIEKNTTIPVILTDANGEVLMSRNIDIQDVKKYNETIQYLKSHGNTITLELDNQEIQYIYYLNSTLLQKLIYYPWIELTIIIAFIIIVIVAVRSEKKVEQNLLWIGLTKETAHQLGTPLSSLQGWVEYLRTGDHSDTILDEMQKDIDRLRNVTARFSKVGSQPEIESVDLNIVGLQVVDYMKLRISNKIKIVFKPSENDVRVIGSTLLLQWVIENIIRNAVDAIKISGEIAVEVKRVRDMVVTLIHDNGCGIPKDRWKKIFSPGVTSKQKGWGVGLTLSKRIIEQYHKGSISVMESEISKGTTFKIVLPTAYSNEQT